MMQRWMVMVAVMGLMPMLMAMRPVDEELLEVAYKGDRIQVQALLEKGAAVNVVTTDGFTPLSLATQMQHTAIAEMLRKKGAK